MRELSAEARLHWYARSLSRGTGTGLHAAALYGAFTIALPSAETRSFLEDGDEVTLRAWCEGNGVRIGFGECVGRIVSS